MLQPLKRVISPELAGILILIASCSPVYAQGGSASTGRGMYAGVLGGGGSSHISSVDQMGTAYYVEAQGAP